MSDPQTQEMVEAQAATIRKLRDDLARKEYIIHALERQVIALTLDKDALELAALPVPAEAPADPTGTGALLHEITNALAVSPGEREALDDWRGDAGKILLQSVLRRARSAARFASP